MADVQELLVNLKFSETGNLAGIKTGLAETEAGAGRLSSAVGGAVISLKNLAIGYIGLNVGFKVLDFFKDSITHAQELEVANAKLTQSLKANVPAFRGNTEAIEAAAKAGEALGFDNSDLIDSLARIVPATHDVNEAIRIQAVAMDLARFKGIDLATASQALVRIEAGRYRGLADLGIVLEKGITQTEALAAVEKVAGGAAEAFGNTSAGAMAKFGVAVQNLQEQIGGGLLPVLTDAANLLSGATGAGLDKQASDLQTQTRDFIRTATPEQLATARSGVAHQLASGAIPLTLADGFLGRNDRGAIKQVLAQLDEALANTSGHIDESARNANRMAQELLNAAAASDELKRSQSVAGDITESKIAMYTAAQAAREYATAMAAASLAARDLAYAVSHPINPYLPGTADANRIFSGLPDTTSDVGISNLAQHNAALEFTANAKAAAAAKAIADAKAAAAAYAQVLDEKLNKALSAAKDLATSLFAKQHEGFLKAIDDVEKLAEKQHDANTQAISDELKLQLQRDAAPVTAAEKAQSDIEISRQNRDLHAALAAAQAGGDPAAIRSAQEALQSFQAQQNINFLKGEQTTRDAAAQADATAKQKVVDDTLNAAKAVQAKAITAENDRNKKQVDDFDKALAALKERDRGKAPGQVQSDITALEKRFGITTDAQGRHHIEDPLVTAIKSVKIPVPRLEFHATLISPPIYIGARQVVAALASHQSPAATPGVRTGILTPARG